MWRASRLAVLCCVLAVAVLARRVVPSSAAPVRDVAAAPAPPRPPTATPTPDADAGAPPLPAAGPGLAVGVTEFNANLVASPADGRCRRRGPAVRDALGAIRPAFFRLVIDWRLDPALRRRARGPRARPHDGLHARRRAVPGLGGVRDQLRALASRQREGGWQALVVLTGTPDWAAAPPARLRARDDARRATARRAPTRWPPTAQLVADVLAGGRRRRAPSCASGAPGTSRTCRRSSARSAPRATPRRRASRPRVYARARPRADAGARPRRPATSSS